MAAGKGRKTSGKAASTATSTPVASPSHRDGPGFPIVGIGASAGGLAAFEHFFAGMPADAEPGMAFVLVQHLAPDHKSILSELVRRYTRMKVYEVEDGMRVQPNCAYIIPPNRDMALLNGRLQLLEPAGPRGQRLPIDYFFRSLAEDQHERAIGIVLSGTGSDGTLGVRAIKGEGGMAMAQSPDTTEFDGMPRSAIATGMVDYQLAPADMAAQLMAYASRAYGAGSGSTPPLSPGAESAMRKVLVLLRSRTGHDFSEYKPSTINRRVERRMAVHQIETVDAYVKYLQQVPDELSLLERDLLIGVTSFFRDPAAFDALAATVFPRLVADRGEAAAIRFWSPGCSTGEEPYSLAIALSEYLEAARHTARVQIFATDIDADAIARARVGYYPASIAADVSPERLARYFRAEPGGGAYRVVKSIRDMLIFSEQSVIKDPPFSRLDLVSCRNLLIYMGGELQKKLIPLFHYALNPGGYLFLGNSETIGEFGDLFAALDRKARLYQRKEGPSARFRVPSYGPSLPPTASAAAGRAARPGPDGRRPLRERMEQALLERASPAGALVTARGDVLYLHGRTGLFLEPQQGDAGASNILTMAREGLRRELGVALRKAALSQAVARVEGVKVRTNGDFAWVNLAVHPLGPAPEDRSEPPLFLVTLDIAPVPAAATAARRGPKARTDGPADESRIEALEREIREREEYIQSTAEELQSANEELKSSNEELQSLNEELQSANEELETSKEEMQSINEELTTINAELQSKVTELSRANNDMNNLLAGTGIATVFVDHRLRVLRFTPAATGIINLIPGDVGRPMADIVSSVVGYARMVEDTRAVLDTLVPFESEVRTAKGAWYHMRIQPYRTQENVIEGAVITFMDVTEAVETRLALRAARDEARLAAVVRDSSDAVTVQDLSGRIVAWNPGAQRLYGWSEAEATAMNVRERIAPDSRDEVLAHFLRIGEGHALAPLASRCLARDGRTVEVTLLATALVGAEGRAYAIATTERPRDPGERNPAG
jgi:two-component system CheB/CheR fusion protein